MGTLYLVATPIGNLEDITLRALRLLGTARAIAAEDTRQTRKLLERYGIRTPLVRYDEYSRVPQTRRLLAELARGDVALVSDAGTPGISDPGADLVQAALAAGHAVTSIPGPSAVAAALAGSGLPGGEFVFLGYLPRKPGDRRRLLASLSSELRTLVAFEVPHRVGESLADLEAAFGAQRPVAIGRELTKLHEEWLRGSLAEARARWGSQPGRGEFTFVIGGRGSPAGWDSTAVRRELILRLKRGESPAQAARGVARDSGWPRRDVYRLALEER